MELRLPQTKLTTKWVTTNIPQNKRRTVKVMTSAVNAEAVITTANRKLLKVRTYLRPILLIITENIDITMMLTILIRDEISYTSARFASVNPPMNIPTMNIVLTRVAFHSLPHAKLNWVEEMALLGSHQVIICFSYDSKVYYLIILKKKCWYLSENSRLESGSVVSPLVAFL